MDFSAIMVTRYKGRQTYKRHEFVRKELKNSQHLLPPVQTQRPRENAHTHTHTHSHSSKEPVLQVLLVKRRKGVAGEQNEKALEVPIEGFQNLSFQRNFILQREAQGPL